MGKRFFILIVLASLFHIKGVNAQQSFDKDNFEAFLSRKFYLQTFKIQEFIDRFNFTEPIVVSGQEVSRSFNLSFLINRQDKALANATSTDEFIQQIGNDTLSNLLSKDEKDWNVFVKCRFTYRNKPLILTLKMGYRGNVATGYKWIIEDVKGDLFQANLSDKPASINPVNNEVGFSELSKALFDKEDILLYTEVETYSPLSSFRDYVKNGNIVFNQIDAIQYVFENIGGWDITVDYYVRMSMNAGWLISSIQKL